jgi:hypothetical protein
MFGNIKLCSPLKSTKVSEEHFASIFRVEEKVKQESKLAAYVVLVSSLAYLSTLKMKATRSSEMSTDCQRTSRNYIPEDRTLYNLCREKLDISSVTSV